MVLLPNLGLAELAALTLLALIIMGPRKIPEIAKALGQTVNAFKKAVKGQVEETKKAHPEPEHVI